MVLASPAVFANDGRRHDRDRHHRYERHDNRYDRHGYGHDRRFDLGVRIVDKDADDRGRRGPSRGDRWSLEFNLVDHRSRVGNGFADCRVTKANGRNWRGTKSHCDVTFRLPDGKTVFHSTSGYYRHDRGRARDLRAEVTLR
jgi:hypothetical protein